MNPERYLLLDRGNTRIKWCLRGSSGRYGSGVAELSELPGLADGADRVLVASVASEAANTAMRGALGTAGESAWFASSRRQSGDLRNSYTAPERLGVDRWLAMLEARALTRDRACVIDAGSALTIDFVSAAGAHEGGYIVPGAALMERALLLDTDRVRFDDIVAHDLSPGSSTAQAVTHGALLALVGAINLALLEAAETGPEPRVFLTGGAAERLEPLLRVTALRCDELVLDGLWRLAQLEGIVPA